MKFLKYEELPYSLRQKFNKELYNKFVDLFKKYNLCYIPAEKSIEYISPDEMGIRQETNLSYIIGLPVDLTDRREREIQQAVAILFYKDGLNTLATNEDLQNAVEVLQNIPFYQEEYHTKITTEKANQEKLTKEKNERDTKVNIELTRFGIPTTEDFRNAYIDLMGVIKTTYSFTQKKLEKKLEIFFDIYGSLFIKQPEVLEAFIRVFLEKSIYSESIVRSTFKKLFEKVCESTNRIQQIRYLIEQSQQAAENEVIRLAKELKPKIEEFQEFIGALIPEQDFISSESDFSIDVPASIESNYSSIIRFSQNSELGKLAKEISDKFKIIKDTAIKANKPWYSIISIDEYKAIYNVFYGKLLEIYTTKFEKHMLNIHSLNNVSQTTPKQLPSKTEVPQRKYPQFEIKQKIQQPQAIKNGRFPKRF